MIFHKWNWIEPDIYFILFDHFCVIYTKYKYNINTCVVHVYLSLQTSWSKNWHRKLKVQITC